MGIDRFYEIVGASVKRVWHRFVGRPVKNFNVENRAYKQIEKKAPAPWHEATQSAIQSHKKEFSSSFNKLDSLNPQLLDRLKEVKVLDNQMPNEPVESYDTKTKEKHPKERFGVELPYVFFKPESIPQHKIAVLDLLELLVNKKKENLSNEQIATMYRLKIEDVDNICKYVGIFQAFEKEKNTEIPMFQKSESHEAFNILKPENDSQSSPKQIVDKK